MNFLTSLMGFIFGSTGNSTIAAVGKLVDDVTTTTEEKAALDLTDTISARTFAAPGNSPGLINNLVDAFNRLIRPGVTLWLIGGFSGWWRLPNTEIIDPVWFQIFLVVISFWFGGRMLVQDAPKFIAALRKK